VPPSPAQTGRVHFFLNHALAPRLLVPSTDESTVIACDVHARRHLLEDARLELVWPTLATVWQYSVYLATPHDVAWHLRTSLDRVILQLLPAMIWFGMLLTGGPAAPASDSGMISPAT
jgi:hypothetical protein